MYLAQIEGRIDSWAVRFAVGQCLNQGLTIYPKYSLVKNIGFDNQATHTKRFNSIYLTRFHEDFGPKNFNFLENQSSLNAIRLLPKHEITELFEEQKTVTMDCEMCGSSYLFALNDVNQAEEHTLH